MEPQAHEPVQPQTGQFPAEQAWRAEETLGRFSSDHSCDELHAGSQQMSERRKVSASVLHHLLFMLFLFV